MRGAVPGPDEADPVVGTADPDAAPAPAPGGAADEVIVCVFGSGAEPFALGVEWATDAAPVHPLADGRIPVCYGTGEETDPSGFATAVLGWEDGRTVRIEVADPVAGRIPVALPGAARFPEVTDVPYSVTLPPYGFFWFSLDEEASVRNG